MNKHNEGDLLPHEVPSEEVESFEDEQLAEAKKKGSLLFRLWAEAVAAAKNAGRAQKNAAAPTAQPPATEQIPLPDENDRMSTSDNFLYQLRMGNAYNPALGSYEVLPSVPSALPPSNDGDDDDDIVISTFRTLEESEALARESINSESPPEQIEEPESLPQQSEEPPEQIEEPPQPTAAPLAEIITYSSFIYEGTPPNKDQQRCFSALQAEARKRLHASTTPAPDGTLPCMDATCRICISQDQYTVHAFVFPPHNGGADITAEDIHIALATAGVLFGVQEDIIEAVAAEKRYLLLFVAACGTLCVNGKDGQVIDHFSRFRQIKLIEREDHTIDYKDLNWIQRVYAGDVICDLIDPVPPMDGCTVLGRAIPGRQGRQLIAPIGKNTQLSEDGKQIIAAIDGQVSFVSQRFCIEPLLVISTDIGPETGNVEVLGNVVIKGNVMEGFSVIATGDILIHGMVESASIRAGGNVQVGAGMNGNMRGTLTAAGTIAAKYLENCTVSCQGILQADNIINCTILCDDKVVVTSGRGVIIGGTITALNGIEANAIGNDFNRTTTIILGSTPGFLANKVETELQLKGMYIAQTGIEQNLQYLARESTPSPDHQQLAVDLKVKLAALKLKLTLMEKEYQDMVERHQQMTGCQICCRAIYPPTQITFGTTGIVVRELIERVRVYYHEGEIHFGSQS